MPQFYFDIDDGDRKFRDDEGTDLPGLKQARDEAIGILPDIARDVLPDGDRKAFVTVVRDEQSRPIFRATLSLVAEWLVPHALK